MHDWTSDLVFSNSRSLIEPRPKTPESPYFRVPQDEWIEVTRELLRSQPLDGPTLEQAVLDSWEDIFTSRIGMGRIGVDIRPQPQVLGFLLHELIPLRVSNDSPDWRRDTSSTEKDLVYVPDAAKSIEIKTSSNPDQIFGNRSFGIENPAAGKKAKSGFYCAVNFERWADAPGRRPEITRIRYGWIDHTDWRAQTAETGQNSSLPGVVYRKQLALLYVGP